MNAITRIFIALFFPAILASPLNADFVNASATWGYTITGQGFTNEVFSGSATFTYDTSSVPLAGSFKIPDILLTSFSQTPTTIGTTTFDLTNMLAEVMFSDGVVNRLDIGGADSGARTMNNLADDWNLIWFGSGVTDPLAFAQVSTSGFTGANTGTSLSGNITLTAVPEPSAFLCLGLAGLAFAGWQRRYQRTA